MKKSVFSGAPEQKSIKLPRLALSSALMSLVLSACVVREGGGGDRSAVDNSLVTGSIRRSAPAAIAPQCAADSAAILAQFIVLEQQNGRPAARLWENSAAGSRGVLSALGQPEERGGALCRQFQTTRESFDGSALYKGEACRYGRQPWALSFLREE